MDKITSRSNSKFKNYLKIKENKIDGLILIEGEDLLNMCLESSFSVKELIVLEYLEEYKEIDQVVLSKELYRELSSYSSLPKLIAVASYSLRKPIGNRIVYLDGVQDPGNFGTIIRTALAFDYYDIVISQNTVSPTNFKCVQATKGALFKVNISYGELEYFEKQGYKLYVTCLDGKDIKDVEKVKEIVTKSKDSTLVKDISSIVQEKIKKGELTNFHTITDFEKILKCNFKKDND